MLNWLSKFKTDWLSGEALNEWRIYWQTDFAAERGSGWLINYLDDYQIGCWTNWKTDCLIDWLLDWLFDQMINRLFSLLTPWPTDCPTDRLTDWVTLKCNTYSNYIILIFFIQEYLQNLRNDPVRSRICKQRVLCRTLAGNFVYTLTVTNPSRRPADAEVWNGT